MKTWSFVEKELSGESFGSMEMPVVDLSSEQANMMSATEKIIGQKVFFIKHSFFYKYKLKALKMFLLDGFH